MRTTLRRTHKSVTALKIAMGGTVLICAAVYSQARAEGLPPLQHQGATQYVSGGIGIDESTAFKSAMSKFPLSLVFSSTLDSNGAYIADVQVVIRNSKGADVLNTTSDGPYFLVKLAPGSYKVSATYSGKTQTRNVKVGSSGSTRASFQWH